MSARRPRSRGMIPAVAAGLVLAACGGARTQAAREPAARFPVAIARASFPARQKLAQRTHLVIAVRNAGTRPIPNVAVTVCNITCAYPAPNGQGTNAAAFGSTIDQANVANSSRPTWIVLTAPGPCRFSCRDGGAGAAVTAYANTWALGRLAPGATARFDWALTAVKAGRHVVAWEVAAGLNGRANAVVAGRGGLAHGTFRITVSSRPQRSYVTGNGQIVTVQ